MAGATVRLCKHLLHNCPQCKQHFRRGELVEVCPGCGTDLHCKNKPVWGSDYCISHGGPAPSRGWYGPGRGIVTGEKSRFQIARLAAKYGEMSKDGRVLSNRKSVEIIRTRIEQLAERIDLNQAPDRLKNLQDLWGKYTSLLFTGAELEARKVKLLIDAEFEAAYHDYAAWQQMFEALELDRKMVESEVKIAKDLKAILTAQDAYELVAKLLSAIIQAAGDIIFDGQLRGRFLRRIEYEFARIVGDRHSTESPEGVGGGGREIISAVTSTLD